MDETLEDMLAVHQIKKHTKISKPQQVRIHVFCRDFLIGGIYCRNLILAKALHYPEPAGYRHYPVGVNPRRFEAFKSARLHQLHLILAQNFIEMRTLL
jgi:hypothetical protein